MAVAALQVRGRTLSLRLKFDRSAETRGRGSLLLGAQVAVWMQADGLCLIVARAPRGTYKQHNKAFYTPNRPSSGPLNTRTDRPKVPAFFFVFFCFYLQALCKHMRAAPHIGQSCSENRSASRKLAGASMFISANGFFQTHATRTPCDPRIATQPLGPVKDVVIFIFLLARLVQLFGFHRCYQTIDQLSTRTMLSPRLTLAFLPLGFGQFIVPGIPPCLVGLKMRCLDVVILLGGLLH